MAWCRQSTMIKIYDAIWRHYATELPYLPHVLYLHMTVHNDKHLSAGNSGTK